jgi:serine/threonine-protein kinase
MGILTQHMYKSPAPIRALIPQPQDVPPGLEAIVLKCLSKKVDLRYQSMDEVIADLDRVERGMVPIAVQEMMSRSGGFNVPADYFRKVQQGGAGMLPATPPMRHKKPVLATVIASVAAFSFLVIAALVAYPLLAAPKAPRVGPELASGPSLDSTGGAPATASGLAAVAPETKLPLFVSVEPPDANVGLENGPLQVGSMTLNLAPTESVNVRFEKKGYVSQLVTIEGRAIDPRSPFKRISLVKEKAPAVVGTAGKGPAGKATGQVPTAPAPAGAQYPHKGPPGMKLDMFGKGCERPLDPDLRK